jgi:hypothetical protein
MQCGNGSVITFATIDLYGAVLEEQNRRRSPPGKSCFAVRASVLLIASVQFDVAITAPLVLEEPAAELAAERHLITVCL